LPTFGQTGTMKAKLFISTLICLSLFGCNKSSNSTPAGPTFADTLAPGWNRITSPAFANDYLQDIFFVGNIGITCGQLASYRSADGGYTWSQIAGNGSNLAMDNIGNILIMRKDTIRVSHDYGNTFYSKACGTTGIIFRDAIFVADKKAYSVFENNFYKTIDAGDSWQATSLGTVNFGNDPYNNRPIFFIDEYTGWAASSSSPATFYKTTDAGVTWTRQYPSGTFDAIFALNDQFCFASGRSQVARTSDGGAIWQTSIFPTTRSLVVTDVHFVSNSTGYVCSDNKIFKTIDGGSTWNKVVSINTIPNFAFVEIHFTDAAHGWACGTNGVVLKFVL
jgi:photosystem II stability/assembly factor-like uncharacterized protein